MAVLHVIVTCFMSLKLIGRIPGLIDMYNMLWYYEDLANIRVDKTKEPDMQGVYYTGRRLPAPRSAICDPKRSVCIPPGKYARI